MANTYLTRTVSSSGSDTKGTISAWVKKSKLGINQAIICGKKANTERVTIGFSSEDRFEIQFQDTSNAYNWRTNALYRDTSGWYNCVIQLDTGNATATSRARVWINGEEITSWGTQETVPQNLSIGFSSSSNVPHVGARGGSSVDKYFDGEMAHVHFIDGTAYDADTFGETDATTGIWKPKTAPSVTYGTNGFFLKFENSGAMGTDSSGNANNFTVNGTMTQTIDTPSNVFVNINPLDNYYPACTFSNGNTTVATGNNFSYCQSTIYVNKGKWYWEVKAISKASGADEFMIGIQGKSATGTNSPAQSNNGITYYKDGDTYGFGGGATSYGNSYTVGDIIGVALDCDNNKLYFSKNGTWQNSGDPTSGATGTGALAITDPNDVPQGGYSPVGGAYTSVSHTLSFNFGNGYFGTTAVSSAQNPDDGIGIFEYAVPTGYKALCTKSINAQEYD